LEAPENRSSTVPGIASTADDVLKDSTPVMADNEEAVQNAEG
jgi:hypothetical protein